ncbi:UNVERIFIED_CONTAM: Copia protein [Sesamum calycinum]|uniref:Copia protein n=1 Tax=Sesamum calycinum TaxID=2727403 RepID=A0AAW2QZN7_9LAMI
MAEGSSVQSYGVKMLSLVEKLKDLKVGLDNDTYIDETLQPPRRKVRGSDARRGRSKRERLSQPLPAPRAPLLPHWEKANGNGKLEVLSGRRQRKGALKEGVPTTPLQPRRLSKDEMILRLGDGKVVAAEAVGSLSLVGYPTDSRQDEVLLEESSEAPQQNDATSFEPSIPIDGVVVFHRSTKESRPLERYRCVGLTSQLDNHPKTYKKAMLDINSDKWFEAMKSKMDSMGSNQLWTLVDPPKSVKPIGCKWVYKHKLGVDGEVTAFKARLVAKGYTQSPVVDFKKIYSPVAMAKSIRILLAIAAWRVSLLLEKNRKSVTFKGPSMASNKFSKAGTRILMKSYRDMISSRTSMILVYIRRSMRALLHTLCFMSMTSCSLEMTSRCYATLKHDCPQFFMKDMGEASYILSIKIYRDRSRRMLRLTQSSYIEKVLKRFKMENSKRGHLPMDMGLSCPRSSLPRLRRSLKGSWTSPMLQSWEAFNMLSSAPGPMSPTLPA